MAKHEGVLTIYDISSATRTVQTEAMLGSWNSHYDYRVLGAMYGIEFTESVIASSGLVQFIHLDPLRDDGEMEVEESVIDELLANGWSLADG